MNFNARARTSSKSALFALLIALSMLAAPAWGVVESGKPFHGVATASLNDHGVLVIALDRSYGPTRDADGVANLVFMYASPDHSALQRIADALAMETRVNLVYWRTPDGTSFDINIPRVMNATLGGPEQEPGTDSRIRVAGQAIVSMNVTDEMFSLADAHATFQDYQLIVSDQELASGQNPNCTSGGYCASSCSLTVGVWECSLECMSFPPFYTYACCRLGNCRCYSKISDPY